VALESFVGPRNKDQHTKDPNIMKTKTNPGTLMNHTQTLTAESEKQMPINPGWRKKLAWSLRIPLTLALAGAWVTTELRAQVIVVPNDSATNDGDSFAQTNDGPSGGVRNMWIFDASQFGALSGPSLLTQVAERPDRIPDASGPRSPRVRIYASTTKRSVANLSTTFAENLGTNTTLIFDGTARLTTANLPGPGNTRQFDIITFDILFPFTTPFLYDPAAGNLLLDLQISSSSGPSIEWDTVSGNPAAGAIFAVGSATAATGDFTSPSVIRFTFESPPLVTIRTSQVDVCWNSKSNLTYQVQYRSDLTTNLWTSLVNCVRSTGAMSCISDPVVVGQPQRFYRVALTNCVPQ
jgi:hypothetical protein